MSQKVVVIFSGGMDSFTVLNLATNQGLEVFVLSFDYGQRHKKELDYAARACKTLGVADKIVDISAINQLIGGSSLTTDIEVAEGHYEEDSMKSTVVPNRNMILLSMAVGYTVTINASKVYYGAHSGDHAIYPDCRPEFVHKMNGVCAIANYDALEIVTPYLDVSKTAILTADLAMGLDYNQTWTCYNGREKACGKCGACQEQLEAFTENGLNDPLAYEG
jgi:7-cyano-7-deazaguanine synthase